MLYLIHFLCLGVSWLLPNGATSVCQNLCKSELCLKFSYIDRLIVSCCIERYIVIILNTLMSMISAISALESPIVKERWLLKKKIGKGTFCEMFLGRSLLPFEGDDSQVAIKLQVENVDKNSIRAEADILKSLSGLETIPRFIKSGKHENREYVVMELLSGEDMAHLRDRIRNKTGLRLISLPGALFLTRQMLKCIRNIHSRGFIHRDIKPANFIRRSYDANTISFVMIDFGITKQYKIIPELIGDTAGKCEIKKRKRKL